MVSKTQRGFTLLEMMLVLGLAMVALLLGFYSKQADLEQSRARSLGSELFQYNNAVRNYLAKHNEIGATTFTGTRWLKNTSCGGSFAVGGEYLPCSFPQATTTSPLNPGMISLTTRIQVSGVAPNRKLTATTVSSPFKMIAGSSSQVRTDLAGLAAITAAAGYVPGSTGSGFSTTTDASFASNPLDGTITMVASNSAAQDVWLRTDGGNSMHASLKFDSSNSLNRQIMGASRIQNLAAEALYLGQNSGIAPVTGAGVVVDANTEIIGALRVRNTLTVDNGANVTGNVSVSSNVTAGAAVMAQIFYDSNNTSYYVDPSSSSNVNGLQAQTINSTGRVSANEYLEVGGVATVGLGCTPNGLLGRDTTGKILSCQNGIWASNGGNISQPVQLFYYGGFGVSRCLTVDRNALVTLSAPGTSSLRVNGTLVGRSYSYGGKHTDVATDATITHVAKAGAEVCFSNSVVEPTLVATGGVRVMGSYLD